MKTRFILAFSTIIILMLSLSATAAVEFNGVVFYQGGFAKPSNSATLEVTIKNTGSSIEQGLVELAMFPRDTLSFVGGIEKCNPAFWYNVHKDYILGPGESVRMILYSSNIPPGTYKAVVTHADKCCTDGVNSFDCRNKQPYGFEYLVGTVTIGDPGANTNDQCDTNYQAGEFLKKKGVMNCLSAVCNDPVSPSSVASCAEFGECSSGSVQSTVCNHDSKTIDIRRCVESKWSETGAKCADSPIVPPPGGENSNSKGIVVLGAIITGLGAGYFVFSRFKSYVVAIIAGLLVAGLMFLVFGALK